MNTPTLETERLILRKFIENDIEAMYRIYSDKEVNKFLPWFPLESLEETRLFFKERDASKYAQPQAYAYAVCLKKDNIPIGYINVDMEEHHDFGYGLRKEFWHQGIITEAGKAVHKWKKMGFLISQQPMIATTLEAGTWWKISEWSINIRMRNNGNLKIY